VAFFFLFFLHGISFGTRKQGISYNTQLINTNVQHKDIETSKNRVNQITHLKQTK